jgi:predicted N-formylglutamate amidohydrolase
MTRINAGLDPYLSQSDPSPVLIHGENRRSPYLLVSDHAGNAIPQHLGSLGISHEALHAHIAWDINAWEQTKELADCLGAIAIGQRYSRLVIDCNRKFSTHDSIAEVSDGVIIPGNSGMAVAERQQRIGTIMMPYHNRIEDELERRRSEPVCIISMHTFTPRLSGGQLRPWHVGVMSGPDDRMRTRVFRLLESNARNLTVGDNEPYVIRLEENYTLPVHAEAGGLPYVQFELRNDMFGDPESRGEICELLADVITQAFEDLSGASS